MRVLLSHGAEVSAMRNGSTAIDLILRGNLGPDCGDIVTTLVEHGCKWSEDNVAQMRRNLKHGVVPRYQVHAEDVLSRLKPQQQKKAKK